MGEFFEALGGGAIWGVGFAVAMGTVQAMGGGLRPILKAGIHTGMAAADWVRSATAEGRETLQDVYHATAEGRETLQDVYHEAKAEREAAAGHETAA